MGSGPFGEEGKCIQLYSLLHHTRLSLTKLDIPWPHHMHHISSRKEALQAYTAQLLGQLDKACGGRVEVRTQAFGGPGAQARPLGELWQFHQMFFNHVQDLLHQGKIQIKKIPVEEARAHIIAAWQWAEAGQCFHGIAAAGPHTQAQAVAFEGKKTIFFNLVATLGWASGKWQRQLLAHIKEEWQGPHGPMWLPRPHRPAVPPQPERGEQDDERVIETLLPDLKTRGNAGQPGSGKPKFVYINGWGPEGKVTKVSQGYDSRACMAMAIWPWANVSWCHRVKHNQP